MGGRGYPHTFYLFRCYISRIPVLSPEFCQFRQYLQVFSTFKGENKIVTKSAPNMVQFQKKKKKKKVSRKFRCAFSVSLSPSPNWTFWVGPALGLGLWFKTRLVVKGSNHADFGKPSKKKALHCLFHFFMSLKKVVEVIISFKSSFT